jgi:hypothetical protein
MTLVRTVRTARLASKRHDLLRLWAHIQDLNVVRAQGGTGRAKKCRCELPLNLDCVGETAFCRPSLTKMIGQHFSERVAGT